MRQIKHGEFTLDVGRKELYTRIPEVERLWEELLGGNYRPYPHRVGSLYDGKIFEMSSKFQGFRRGMSWSRFLLCGIDLLWGWANLAVSRPRTYEQYWHRSAGRRFSHLLAQGYWEKFRGQKWADMPVPEIETNGHAKGSYQFQAIKKAVSLALGGEPSQQSEWRHPANGTGQIGNILERRILESGGRIQFESEVTEIIWSDGRIREVGTQTPAGKINYRPTNVISSLPIELLGRYLFSRQHNGSVNGTQAPDSILQSVVLVYLFLDEEPRFPHAWLEVNDPKVRAGRITNYAAFNGDMVPKGQTCLCVEFFCVGADPLLDLDPAELRDLAMQECVSNGLVDSVKCYDYLAVKMPRVNAATSWREWQESTRLQLLDEVRQFENLYHINRPGMDKACYAGLEAAMAVLSGDRAGFDQRTAPDVKSTETRLILQEITA